MVSIGLVNYFFMEPVHSFHVFSDGHRLSLVMFTLMGALFAFSLHRMQTTTARQLAAAGRFRTLFEEAPLGVALIDSHTGRIYEINPRFAEIAGRAREDMVTIDWMSITHPDDIQPDLDNMARLNAGDIPGFQMDKRYLKPDGTVVWISMTIAPVSVAPGESPRHLCMIGDITERLRAEATLRQEELFSQAMIDSIPGIFYVFDEHGHYLRWNARQRDLILGHLDDERLSHTPVLESVHPEDRDRIGGHIADLFASGKNQTVAGRVLLRGGPDFRWFLLNGKRLIIDGKPYLVGTGLDITDQRQVEERLRESEAQFRRWPIPPRSLSTCRRVASSVSSTSTPRESGCSAIRRRRSRR